jgi:DNA topoisomerase-1
METTYIRVGNAEYARENHSYGLTTMRGRHVQVEGSKITFKFQGKSGVHHTIDLQDRRLAKIIRRCQDLPGYELFQYIGDDGETHSIDSADVNDYLREVSYMSGMMKNVGKKATQGRRVNSGHSMRREEAALMRLLKHKPAK